MVVCKTLLLTPLHKSLPELSLGMAGAAGGDPPFSLLLRLLDLPDLLQAEAGADSTFQINLRRSFDTETLKPPSVSCARVITRGPGRMPGAFYTGGSVSLSPSVYPCPRSVSYKR